MTHGQKRLIFISLLYNAVVGMALDIYVPSMPHIAQYFGTSATTIQLTIVAYMLGYGIFQFFFGISTDTFGRRPMLLIGTLLMVIFSVLAAYSPSEHFLLAMRFMQGFALAIASSGARAVFADVYEGKELAKMLMYYNLFWGMGPIIGPFIGGYLQAFFGWRAPLLFLGIYSGLMFILLLFTKETLQHKHKLHPKVVSKNVGQIISHSHFWIFIMVAVIMYACIILFNTVGPFLIQTRLHYSPVVFGHIGLCTGLAFFIGTFSNRFTGFISPNIRIIAGLTIAAIASLIMVILALTEPMNLWAIFIPTWFVILGAGVAFTCCFASCIGLFTHISGTIGALWGTVLVIGTGIVGGISALLSTQTAAPFAIMYLIILIAGFALIGLRLLSRN